MTSTLSSGIFFPCLTLDGTMSHFATDPEDNAPEKLCAEHSFLHQECSNPSSAELQTPKPRSSALRLSSSVVEVVFAFFSKTEYVFIRSYFFSMNRYCINLFTHRIDVPTIKIVLLVLFERFFSFYCFHTCFAYCLTSLRMKPNQ